MSNSLVSEFTSTLLSVLNLGVGVSTFLVVGITSAVLPIAASAQSTGNSQPIGNVTTQQNERSTMYGGNGEDFNVFNLIHRAQMGTPRDINEVSAEQSQSITNAAEKYRLEQLRRLGTQQQNENQVTTPTTGK
ncbi:MAG: hypothetical protein U7123_08450 [Potamolinea sp.]